VSSTGLDRILEHNPGDFTAVVQAGVTLAEAQRAFAGAGQWLAVDPPEPSGTIGGLVATADSGPSRHRYGGMRDLIIGITVVLSDGTVASAGGKVIKNVAGYDLGKLFTGSYGTLGLIASVAVRLHPRPARTVTLTGTTRDPALLQRVALRISHHPLEALCLDAFWADDSGQLLVRFGGVAAPEQATRTEHLLDGLKDVSIVDDDEPLWTQQRARQRRLDGVVVKVSGRPTDLSTVVSAAQAGGATVVSRAGLGLSWLTFAPTPDLPDRVGAARRALADRATTVLDGAHLVDEPWPPQQPGVTAVMRRVKARFDPARIFRPGAFVGGL
jgi:glycolate oxidase FAD binding subunit